MNNTLKSSNGITLIALVITIIVLLILAGISISMLSGDNGILQKATDAKTNTEKATVVELAKTDVLGQIAENKGEALTETQLKTILSKYFEDFDDALTEDLSETTITLTAKEVYGGYTNIALADIYNGKILIESNLDMITFYIFGISNDILGTYEAEKGMTFRQWIDKYSPEGFRIEENYVYTPIGIPLYIGSNAVYPDSVIYDETSYNLPPA